MCLKSGARMEINMIKRCVALLLTGVVILSMAACGSKSTSTITPGSSILQAPKKPVTEAPVKNANEIDITGVLTQTDAANLKMNFLDTDTGTEYEVAYTGGTDIKDKYGTIKAASVLKQGGIYDVTCDKTGKAVKIYESSKAWERNSVTDLEIDESSRKLSYGDNSFQYSDHAVILSGPDKISIAQVVAEDEVPIRGIDSSVYSVTVDKGHGYIQFTGIDSFIGGYVSVGQDQLFGITKSMMVTAKEGTYTVDLQNGSISGSKTVTVERDKQVSVDFSEYTTGAAQVGAVNFSVTPQGAIMEIDGEETDYSKPVSLTYGKHKIVLKANYFDEYSTVITINKAYQTQVIDMTSTDKSTTKAAQSDNKNNQQTTQEPTTRAQAGQTSPESDKTDGYTVNVTAPEGAALYVDSQYIGIVPCSFEKKAGNKTVTLSQNGFKTVSYNISLTNTTGNATYSFPDMVKSSGE